MTDTYLFDDVIDLGGLIDTPFNLNDLFGVSKSDDVIDDRLPGIYRPTILRRDDLRYILLRHWQDKRSELDYIKKRKYELLDAGFVSEAVAEVCEFVNSLLPGVISWVTTPPVSHDTEYHLAVDLAIKTASNLGIEFYSMFNNWHRKGRWPTAARDDISFSNTVRPEGVCLLLDDVLTSGITLLTSATYLRNHGMIVFPVVYIGGKAVK